MLPPGCTSTALADAKVLGPVGEVVTIPPVPKLGSRAPAEVNRNTAALVATPEPVFPDTTILLSGSGDSATEKALSNAPRLVTTAPVPFVPKPVSGVPSAL